ncbi:ligase-associated DNA damage response endonuclease PdeM [Henriciella aquimarina]|uniref:ligase-associated DNA damage response endonuclease PdeM n=1 Tax=Henriciella aquimarina TaxID=545261 RepID=UPI000A00CBDA|nr:ligase-associated DNA damage response endonuclease PdeM [Henriciella aquimarina]
MSLALKAGSPDTFLCVAGEMFLPTGQGALWWERERTLVVSDLHLEKGSSYARRGQLLPPYDTGATLSLVEQLVRQFQPDRVISLGDSFHDRRSEARLSPDDRSRIRTLTAATQWHWVEGNHDPDPPADLGGQGAKVLHLGACVFRHEPTGEVGEIAGHLHPVAKIAGRGRALRRKAFITDGSSLVMPSLGTFTGGLNVLHQAMDEIFHQGAMVFAANGTSVSLIERRALRPDKYINA